MPKATKETKQAEGRFSKSQLIASKKYKDNRDVLSAILSESYLYSHDEVDAMLKDFMEKGV